MNSISTLIKCLIVVTLLLCYCNFQATASSSELGDDLLDTLPIEHHRLYHDEFRRASLRYQPHIFYKKASLRPILVSNGKVIMGKRERKRRSAPVFIDLN